MVALILPKYTGTNVDRKAVGRYTNSTKKVSGSIFERVNVPAGELTSITNNHNTEEHQCTNPPLGVGSRRTYNARGGRRAQTGTQTGYRRASVGGGLGIPVGVTSEDDRAQINDGQGSSAAPEPVEEVMRHNFTGNEGGLNTHQIEYEQEEEQRRSESSTQYQQVAGRERNEIPNLNTSTQVQDGLGGGSQGGEQENPEGPGILPRRRGNDEQGRGMESSQRIQPGQDNQGYTFPDQAQLAHPNRRARRELAKKTKKNTKASTTVVSLNLNGYGGSGPYHRGNRWTVLNRLMGENKIGLALVQETHMTEIKRAETEHVFRKRMKIFASNHPTNPTAAGGVAVVINKNLLHAEDAEAKEVIPGRALLVKVNWHQGEKLTVLVVYAPNVTSSDGTENAAFWGTIKEFLQQPVNHRWRPDLVAGDCNMVEDAIDRLPMREDPREAVDSLDGLKMELGLRDGWRDTFPDSKQFTFSRNDSQSRLDRIYVTNKILRTA
ncbi:hypothetical protein D9757_012704 [Collybiopsis confluens]|uniref:Endonuclease/exonuclease/phosphatase domain-containing protein n=1 Tax=Collybiopsis confluens TaxID=2823264 RepID=A0A8H5LM75_9AGAR|nr:hypothetical protein D9757_014513 [Collybiopsis confluens]KAF5366091.1 hypothetical protein D9757_012704 [Collybiopsis confluens]